MQRETALNERLTVRLQLDAVVRSACWIPRKTFNASACRSTIAGCRRPSTLDLNRMPTPTEILQRGRRGIGGTSGLSSC